MLKNKYRFVGDDMEIVMKRRNGSEVVTVIERADFPLMWIYFGSWYALWSTQTNSFYARGHINSRPISLHQYLMDARRGEIVDHRDRDTLNNRRSNLRKASIPSQRLQSVFQSGQITKRATRRSVGHSVWKVVRRSVRGGVSNLSRTVR